VAKPRKTTDPLSIANKKHHKTFLQYSTNKISFIAAIKHTTSSLLIVNHKFFILNYIKKNLTIEGGGFKRM
jgi:hypothetical protein